MTNRTVARASRPLLAAATLLLSLFCTGCGLLDGLLPPSKQTIDQAFDAQRPDLRREAIVKLTRHRGGLQEPMLAAYAEFSKDADPVIRAIAINALARAGDAAYLPVLAAGLDDDDHTVRMAAAEAFYTGTFASDAVGASEKLYLAAAGSTDHPFRARCLEALGRWDNERTRQTLLRAVEDDHFEVRLAARRTLGAITGEDLRYDRRAWSRLLKTLDAPPVEPTEPPNAATDGDARP